MLFAIFHCRKCEVALPPAAPSHAMHGVPHACGARTISPKTQAPHCVGADFSALGDIATRKPTPVGRITPQEIGQIMIVSDPTPVGRIG